MFVTVTWKHSTYICTFMVPANHYILPVNRKSNANFVLQPYCCFTFSKGNNINRIYKFSNFFSHIYKEW